MIEEQGLQKGERDSEIEQVFQVPVAHVHPTPMDEQGEEMRMARNEGILEEVPQRNLMVENLEEEEEDGIVVVGGVVDPVHGQDPGHPQGRQHGEEKRDGKAQSWGYSSCFFRFQSFFARKIWKGRRGPGLIFSKTASAFSPPQRLVKNGGRQPNRSH